MLSSRANQIFLSYCSLVEAFLAEIAYDQESEFELHELGGSGRDRLKRFLNRLGVIDFGKLSCWAAYGSLYELRNVITHSYGIVQAHKRSHLRKTLEKLGPKWSSVLKENRLRINASALESTHSICSTVVMEAMVQYIEGPDGNLTI